MTRLLPRRNQHDKSQRLYKIINMITIEYGLYVIFVSLMCTSEMLVCVYIFRLIACVNVDTPSFNTNVALTDIYSVSKAQTKKSTTQSILRANCFRRSSLREIKSDYE